MDELDHQEHRPQEVHQEAGNEGSPPVILSWMDVLSIPNHIDKNHPEGAQRSIEQNKVNHLDSFLFLRLSSLFFDEQVSSTTINPNGRKMGQKQKRTPA